MRSIIIALLVALVLLVGLFISIGRPYLVRKMNERQQQRDADRGSCVIRQPTQLGKDPDGVDCLADHHRTSEGS